MTGSPPEAQPVLRPCGDTGWLLDLPGDAEVPRWAAAVRDAELAGVVEVVPGFSTLLVEFEPARTTGAAVREALRKLELGDGKKSDDVRHVIDVRYDGADLDEVARLTGLTAAEVVEAHTGTPWRVSFCGFAPGFSYLVGGDPRLQVPRRNEARVRVPAGAVAIAGQFSSIYPRASPGGWQLLGHTDVTLWDEKADPPALLLPGAVVEFRDVRSP